MALAPDSTLHETYRITYVADSKPDGSVYRAVDAGGQRVLIAALPQLDDEEQAATAALCSHLVALSIEGLLPLKDHFAEGRVYYLVCDDPGGQDLERYVREWGGPMPESHVLNQMERLLLTLEELHNYKPPLYLGDLRSSDLWSNTNRDLLLTPFPLARPVSEQDNGFRAPELAKASEEADSPSDLYSFGVLFYQMLTGWMPPTAVQRVAGTPLNAPRTLNGHISALAEQAALRSLELKKTNRYQAAYEMRQALKTVHMMAGRSLGMDNPPLSGMFQPQPSAPSAPPQVPPPAPQPVPGYNAPPMPQPAPGYAPQPYPQHPQQPQQPAPQGYAVPPNYGTPPNAPMYAQPYGGAAPLPQRRSNTCLIVTVVVLAILALLVLIALVAVLLGPGRALFTGAAGSAPTVQSAATSAATTGGATTSAPTAVAPQAATNPAAISVASAAGITETGVLTESVAGPLAFSSDGKVVAVGFGNTISVRDGTTLESQHTLSGHAGSLNTLAFSPDGTILASGAIDDPTIRLWTVATGQSLRQITGHTGWVRTLAFSPDGTTLASGSTDKTIRLWNVATGAAIRTLSGHTDYVSRIVFSPDGTTLASTSRDGTVRLWDVANGSQKPEFSFTAPQNPRDSTGSPFWMTGLSFSPDGTLLAAGSIDHKVRIWTVATGKLEHTLEGHTQWILPNTLTFSPDGKTLASGSLDGTVRLWDPTSGAERGTLSNNGLSFVGLAFEPDGAKLVTSSDEAGSLAVWDVGSQKIVQSVRLGQGLVTSLAYSNDGAVLGTAGMNGLLRLHALNQNKTLEIAGGLPASQALAFVDPTHLAALSDGGVVLIDLTQEQQARPLSGLDSQAVSVITSADGTKIAAGSADGKVGLWDAKTGQSLRVIQAQPDRILNMAFSSDGTFLAAGSSADTPEIVVLDVASGERKQAFSGHAGAITALSFQPKGSLLASGSSDGTLRLWNIQTGAQVNSFNVPPEQGLVSSLSFSPDGSVLAAGTLNGTVTLWDPAKVEIITAIPHPLTIDGVNTVLSLAFRPDGEQLAASMSDHSVRIIEVRKP